MAVKILFFDTSALLKMFVKEDGTDKIKWLTSSKVKYSLHFNINEQVSLEFENKIQDFIKYRKVTQDEGNSIIRNFLKNYKGKYFRVIGQNIISNTKSETDFAQIKKDLALTEGKDDWDGYIYQSIINALAVYSGESHPILVTCDNKFAKKIQAQGYRVINPQKQSIEEINNIIS